MAVVWHWSLCYHALYKGKKAREADASRAVGKVIQIFRSLMTLPNSLS